MTRDESLTIVEMVVNSWPGPPWEAERLDAYARAIEPLDAEVTTRAVIHAVRVLKFRPSVAELREFVRIERALSEPEQAQFVNPDKPARPAWVLRWERARAADDWRPFPEQMTGMDQLARVTPEDYEAYAPPNAPVTDPEHWVQESEYRDEPPGTDAIIET